MLSHEQMIKLIELPDKESVIDEVAKMSEDEAKQALIAALLSWKNGNKINEEIECRLRARIAELEKQLGI